MPQLLIELFSEEIPARMQLGAARDLERLFDARLKAQGLGYEAMKAYVGPRRLALVVDGLPVEQAAVTEETKGPKEGAPPQAMEGFLRKVGLTQDQLVVENGVWMARVQKPAKRTVDALPAILEDVILNFPWPKSMRSGTSTFRWVRPLKRIVFLFDGAVVPFELEGLTASDLTEGHRFLGKGQPLKVSNFTSYKQALADDFVVLDHADRQSLILEKAKAAAEAQGYALIEDQGLLEEVAGLNEWPVPLLGDMDPQFLTLPPEVIKTSMRTHQKYFAVSDPKAALKQQSGSATQTLKMAAKFMIVANMQAVDGGEEIKRGNAKVLSARLSDGVFFWKEDNRPNNFDQWLTKLKGVTFHAKLGTMAERVERIVALAQHIAPFLKVDAAEAAEAARLSKADLASYMVGEFPELQGVMGGYYAEAAGLKPAIASAIRDHYKPQGPSDSLPSSPLSAVVALADKIDTLVSFFFINEKPTGSKDPFALRRCALGVLRIIREYKLSTEIEDILVDHMGILHSKNVRKLYDGQRARVVEAYYEGKVSEAEIELVSNGGGVHAFSLMDAAFAVPDSTPERILVAAEKIAEAYAGQQSGIEWRNAVYPRIDELLAFFQDRLKVMLRDEGVRFDVLDAVFAVRDGDLIRSVNKVTALEDILSRPEGEDLVAAHKRAGNILAAEAKKGALPEGAPVALPGAPEAEIELVSAVLPAISAVEAALVEEKFTEALLELAALRKKVDNFLDQVLVNADESAVRLNRLKILNAVHGLSKGVADLSKLA